MNRQRNKTYLTAMGVSIASHINYRMEKLEHPIKKKKQELIKLQSAEQSQWEVHHITKLMDQTYATQRKYVIFHLKCQYHHFKTWMAFPF